VKLFSLTNYLLIQVAELDTPQALLANRVRTLSPLSMTYHPFFCGTAFNICLPRFRGWDPVVPAKFGIPGFIPMYNTIHNVRLDIASQFNTDYSRFESSPDDVKKNHPNYCTTKAEPCTKRKRFLVLFSKCLDRMSQVFSLDPCGSNNTVGITPWHWVNGDLDVIAFTPSRIRTSSSISDIINNSANSGSPSGIA
jgi:hypothetical protein